MQRRLHHVHVHGLDIRRCRTDVHGHGSYDYDDC